MKFFLNLQQMTIVRGLSVDIKIVDLISCLPLPKGYVLLLFLNNHWFYPQHSGERYRTNGPLVIYIKFRAIISTNYVFNIIIDSRQTARLTISSTIEFMEVYKFGSFGT